MWVRRLAVEHWRGLSYVLEGLTPGLNLIAGPNESGKTRLVEALRFALFESSSGQAAYKRDLQTWGLAPGKPRVTVEFDLAGTDWRLEKVFLERGCNTRLRSRVEEIQGEPAEARLAELLEVSGGSGRTEVKPEDRGVWSLLWVEQGASRERPAHTSVSHGRLLNQLTEEIGEVAAGELGRRMLERATEYRNRYYTPRSGDERKVLTDARERVSGLEGDLAEAVTRRAELADAAEELQRARARAADLERRHRAAAAEHREVAARQRTAEKLHHELSVAEADLGHAEGEPRAAGERLERVEELGRRAQAMAARIAESSARWQQAEAAVTAATQGFDAANDELASLEQRADRLDVRLRRLRRLQALAERRDELARLQQRLASGQALAARQLARRRELAGLPPLTAKDVGALRQAVAAHATAAAQLEGASVSIEITARRELRVDGRTLAAGETIRILVAENRRIEVSDVVSIGVNPGAGELVARRDAVQSAARGLAAMRERFGVSEPDEAARIVERRTEVDKDLRQLAESLEEWVPEGLDALDRRVQALRAEIDASSEDDTGGEGFGVAGIAVAEEERRVLGDTVQRARAIRDAEQGGLSRAREDRARLRVELELAQRQHEALTAELAGQPDPAALRAAVEAAERTFRERVAARDEARRRFEVSGGERLAEDVERAAKAEEQLGVALQETRDTCVRLETTLHQAGRDRRHEQVQALEADLEQARAERDRLLREAAAAQRLLEVLDREYRSARERLTEPVMARIRGYLEDLFPGCEAWLDEELELRGLRSPEAHEAFEFLSGGAREQLSLLVRIGLAEVFGAEESWPLVLDDVLVNTDAERIRRMQRALYHAGRRMQILLFTCHGALFDALGPDAYIELPAGERGRRRPGD